jgi:hypothetical protein
LNPTLPVEVETRKQVIVYEAQTAARRAVRKSKAFRFYPLEFRGRKQSEYDAFEPVWDVNYPGTTIEWVNATVNATGQFYFDSELTWRPAKNNLLDYAVALKRRDAQTVVTPASSVLPFVPSYGYDVKLKKEIALSDAVSYLRKVAALSGTKRPIDLVFRFRSLAQVLELEQFWDYHYPCRQISFTEPVLNIERDFWIDSNFKWRVLAKNLVDCSFAIREV